MRELGEHSDVFHAELSGPIEAAGVDYAILVGEAMQPLAEALEGRIDFVELKFLRSLHPLLTGEIRKLVTVKGYQSIRGAVRHSSYLVMSATLLQKKRGTLLHRS